MKRLKYILGIVICIAVGFCIYNTDAQAKTIGDGGRYKNVATNYKIGDFIATSAPYQLDGDYNSIGHNYYKMKIDKKTYLSMTAVTTKHDEKAYVTIEDANGKWLMFESTDDDDNMGFQSVYNEIALSPGTYYIDVTGATYCSYTTVGVEFKIKQTETKNTKIGTYKNTYKSTACNVSIGNKFMGVINSSYNNERNYFKFKINSTKDIKITGSCGSDTMPIFLYNSKGKVIKCIFDKKVNTTVTLKKGTYYIEIENGMNGEIIDYYSLTLKDVTVKKPATPVLKKVSSNLEFSYKKNEAGCKYQVQMSTKKSMKGAKIYNMGALITYRRNKRYYFRVRAYRTGNNKKVYSGWSNVKSAKLK